MDFMRKSRDFITEAVLDELKSTTYTRSACFLPFKAIVRKVISDYYFLFCEETTQFLIWDIAKTLNFPIIILYFQITVILNPLIMRFPTVIPCIL